MTATRWESEGSCTRSLAAMSICLPWHCFVSIENQDLENIEVRTLQHQEEGGIFKKESAFVGPKAHRVRTARGPRVSAS